MKCSGNGAEESQNCSLIMLQVLAPVSSAPPTHRDVGGRFVKQWHWVKFTHMSFQNSYVFGQWVGAMESYRSLGEFGLKLRNKGIFIQVRTLTHSRWACLDSLPDMENTWERKLGLHSHPRRGNTDSTWTYKCRPCTEVDHPEMHKPHPTHFNSLSIRQIYFLAVTVCSLFRQ